MNQPRNINQKRKQTQNQRNKTLSVEHFWRRLSSFMPEWQKNIIFIIENLLPALDDEYNSETCSNGAIEGLARDLAIKSFGENFYETTKWTVSNCINELQFHAPQLQSEIVNTIRTKIETAVDNRAGIKSRLQVYSDILKNLDNKTKLIILLVEECFSLTGVNVDSFHKETEAQIYNKCDSILMKTADDPDCELLQALYQDAAHVRNQ